MADLKHYHHRDCVRYVVVVAAAVLTMAVVQLISYNLRPERKEMQSGNLKLVVVVVAVVV